MTRHQHPTQRKMLVPELLQPLIICHPGLIINPEMRISWRPRVYLVYIKKAKI